MEKPGIIINQPEWLQEYLPGPGEILPAPETKMGFAARLAEQNVIRKTGGPFAAAVFDIETSRLISAGVNTVETGGSSILHAEICAIVLAQQKLAQIRLARCELVTSCEPCAMCLAALVWAGIEKVTCGASEKDAEQCGFDEGDKPENFREKLRARGIQITENVLREQAARPLKLYKSQNGNIY